MKRFQVQHKCSVRAKIDAAYARGDWEGCDDGVLFWVFELAFLLTQDEDTAQDATIRVWQKRELFDSQKSALSTWATRVISNVNYDALRQVADLAIVGCDMPPVENSEGEQTDGFEAALDERGTCDEVEGGERMSPLVRKALSVNREKLPSDEARIVFARLSLGESVTCIAKSYECEAATMKKRISRWRQIAA
ncbi:sigma factor [Telmatobacter sp. DSM 110680]|uniref:Sigma factor n=1 Tax=Telmatobacter sp. DSM 110680 TaxID=3036704 RepID=A0AAU7DEH7_9BACT